MELELNKRNRHAGQKTLQGKRNRNKLIPQEDLLG